MFQYEAFTLFIISWEIKTEGSKLYDKIQKPICPINSSFMIRRKLYITSDGNWCKPEHHLFEFKHFLPKIPMEQDYTRTSLRRTDIKNTLHNILVPTTRSLQVETVRIQVEQMNELNFALNCVLIRTSVRLAECGKVCGKTMNTILHAFRLTQVYGHSHVNGTLELNTNFFIAAVRVSIRPSGQDR